MPSPVQRSYRYRFYPTAEQRLKLEGYFGAAMKWSVAQGHRNDNPAGDAIGAALPNNGVRRDHQRALPLSDSTLSKLCRDNGIGCVPHGMRSSFRDWCGDTGQSREVAEQALAHVIRNKAEATYARSDLFDRRRRLMDAWASYLSGYRASVVPIRPPPPDRRGSTTSRPSRMLCPLFFPLR